MQSKKMEKALNKQINEELFSSYLYLAMSAWFESRNLPGFAQWMKVQAGEENEHAMKIFNFIFERRGDVELEAIEKPQAAWKSPLDAFEAAFKHEQHISGCINDLMDLAISEKDHATQAFLQWFVNEQVEEEASADAIVQQLRMIGESKNALFMLDRALGQRQAD
ncbi:MAG: ferritin [Acidobacteria bacterium]|nr:ferritin [Acidobacteriota bacterium]